MDYRFALRLPTATEHRALASSVGWDDHFDDASIAASIAGSLFGVVVMNGEDAVGMGRLVGDGVHYFYVQDVIVHPDHAESGLGSGIVERLLAWVAEVAPAEAVVGLFASDEARGLYAELGFTTSEATGMQLTVTPLAGDAQEDAAN